MSFWRSIFFRDENGQPFGNRQIGNKIQIIRTPFMHEIARGNVPGSDPFLSLGERGSIAVVTKGSDVWPGAATTVPIPDQSVGEQMSLVSTSGNDTSGGTGIQSVYIHYLDNTGNVQIEEKTLGGLTPVDTIFTNGRFIQDIHASSIGSNEAAEGDITIFRKTDSGRIYNIITAGSNMSLTINKMVPAGKTYYLSSWQCTAGFSKYAGLRLISTDHNGQLYPGIFLFKDSASIENSSYLREFESPLKIPGLSIVKVSAWTNVAGAYVSASFEGWYE